MKNFILHSNYKPAGDQISAIESLSNNIQKHCKKQTLLGITGSGKTFTMAKVIEKLNRPAIILAHNKTLAAQLYSEMKNFFPKNAVEYFVSYYDYYQPEAYVASSDTYIAKDASINDQIEQMRLSATKSILERKDVIIIASVSAIYGLGDPELYMKMVLPLKVGDIASPQKISEQLTHMQYKRLTTHLERGCFRIQGDTIDIFPAESEKKAIRIELFDEEIENILSFDPLTTKIFQHLSHTTVFPKTHYSTPQDILKSAVEKIKQELKVRLIELKNNNKLVEAQRLEERTNFDIEMIEEMGYCTGIENYSRYLSNQNPGEPPATLMDYLPQNSILFIDESHMTIPQIRGMHLGDRSRKLNLVEHGFRLPSALDNRPLVFSEFEQRMPETIFVSATPGEYEQKENIPVIEQVIRPTGLIDPVIEIRPIETQVDDLYQEIQKTIVKNERILVTTLTKRMSENLTNYLDEQGIKVRYLHSDIDSVERVEIIRSLRMGHCDVIVGINLLREGLDMPEVSLVAILDADKEGFLRSYRSLIQTIGRAARNINGRVILYADKITNSIEKAMDETTRRRKKQIEYNKKNNIQPKSIQKNMIELIPGLSQQVTEKDKKIFQEEPIHLHSEKEYLKRISQIEKLMKKHASLLEFEKAAAFRDELTLLKQQLMKML